MNTLRILLALVVVVLVGVGCTPEPESVAVVGSVTASLSALSEVPAEGKVVDEAVELAVVEAPQLSALEPKLTVRADLEQQTLLRLREALELGNSQAAAEYSTTLYLIQASDLIDPVVQAKRSFEPQFELLPLLGKMLFRQVLEGEFEGNELLAARAFAAGNRTAFAVAMETVGRNKYEEVD